MSYIEKEKLIKADIASIENRVRHAFNQGYDLGFKDGKERAKPLEQGLFKQKYIEREVLDKIRAEIEPTRKMYLEMNDIDWLNGCDYVLSVIDKYKAETEET